MTKTLLHGDVPNVSRTIRIKENNKFSASMKTALMADNSFSPAIQLKHRGTESFEVISS